MLKSPTSRSAAIRSTELANPYAPTGFNPDLESQTATNYELGIKGLVTGRTRFELALFRVDVRDAIVPFELEGSGQSFFQNAGSSTHQGLETSVALETPMAASTTETVFPESRSICSNSTSSGRTLPDGMRAGTCSMSVRFSPTTPTA